MDFYDENFNIRTYEITTFHYNKDSDKIINQTHTIVETNVIMKIHKLLKLLIKVALKPPNGLMKYT